MSGSETLCSPTSAGGNKRGGSLCCVVRVGSGHFTSQLSFGRGLHVCFCYCKAVLMAIFLNLSSSARSVALSSSARSVVLKLYFGNSRGQRNEKTRSTILCCNFTY